MPYEIKKLDDQFCVVKKDTTERVPGGCHSSEDAAKQHMAALYANVGDAKSYEMPKIISQLKAIDLDYASGEAFDVQTAASAIQSLATLAAKEASEKEEDHVRLLYTLIAHLNQYILDESQEAIADKTPSGGYAEGKSMDELTPATPTDEELYLTEEDVASDPDFWDEIAAENWAMEPQKAKDPKKPYGDVAYADPGYQKDGKKRYPIDTEAHIRAAWNYINKPKNAAKYGGKAGSVKAKIVAAWKRVISKDGPPSAGKKSMFGNIEYVVGETETKAYYTGTEEPGTSSGDQDGDEMGGPSDGDADNFHSHAHIHMDSGIIHEHTHEHDRLHGADDNSTYKHTHIHGHAPKVAHAADKELAKLKQQSPEGGVKPPEIGSQRPMSAGAAVGALEGLGSGSFMTGTANSEYGKSRDPHAVKMVGDNIVAAYGIHYASDHPKFGKEKDLTGQFFTKNTYLGNYYDKADIYYHHGADGNVGLEVVGTVKKAEIDKNGVWVMAQLDKSSKYFNEIKQLVKQGRLFWSSGTASHLSEYTNEGEIKRWPIVEWSLTPTPAEPRLEPVSFYKSIGIDADSLVTDGRAVADSAAGQKRGEARNESGAESNSPHRVSEKSNKGSFGGIEMTPEEIQAQVTKSVTDALAAFKATEAAEAAKMQAETKAKADAETAKQAEIKSAVDKALAEFKASLPAEDTKNAPKPPFYSPNMNMKWGIGELSIARAVKAMSLASRGMPDPWSGAPNEKRVLVDRQSEIKATLGEGIGQYGGYLVPPEWLQDQFIPLLRARAVVRQSNPRVIQTNSDTVYLPTQTGGATANWLGENATIGSSGQTFGQVAVNIKKLGALTYISNELLMDASPSVDNLVREDLAAVIANTEDTGFLTGDGTVNSPIGLLNWNGNQQVTLAADTANGGALAVGDLFAFKKVMMQANVPFDGMAWFCSPRTWDEIAQLKDGQNRYLLDTLTGSNIANYPQYGNYPATGPETSYAGAVQGKLFGWPVYVTANITETATKGTLNTASYLFFCRMADVVIVERAGLELMATNVAGTAFASDQTWIRAIERVGFGVRHAKGVVYANGLS